MMRRAALIAAAFLTAATTSAQSPAPPLPPAPPALDAADVVGHVTRTIQWYRAVAAAAQQGDAGDLGSRNSLQQSALSALQLAFDFARAEAALIDTARTPARDASAPVATNLEQLDARLTERVASLQARLGAVNASLSHASAKQAAALTNERDTLSAQLELTKTLQTSVQDIVRFASTSAAAASGAGTLAAQIAALERTVPEARHTVSPSAARGAAATQPAAAATPASTAAAADVPAFQPESAGIVALATELVGTAATSRSLSNLVKQTDAVTQSIESTRAPLVADLRVLIRNVDAASSAPAAPLDPHAVQSAVARVKQISTALVPLAEQGVAVEHARAALVSARTTVSEHMALAGRYVLMRILALAVAIAALLIVSEFWRRATFRYLHDPHRRRQFLLLRRIVVAGAVVAILVIAFVSQIGSLATYAGFVTAGLAVALQNVLLAVIAYFLLIGRYGVHVGDRVTIGGVTGSVIEIGLIRMYLMELAAPDWHPTGRIVVFSNAVLFQPSALFKQLPGVDYAWHTVRLTLAPTADLPRAEEAIRGAATSAFEPFRESLQRQYAAMQEQVDMTTPVPGPHVQIHLADQGVDVLVRYPVEPKRANEMDNRMLTAVRDALAAAPSVPLAPSGAPALDDAKDHAG